MSRRSLVSIKVCTDSTMIVSHSTGCLSAWSLHLAEFQQKSRLMSMFADLIYRPLVLHVFTAVGSVWAERERDSVALFDFYLAFRLEGCVTGGKLGQIRT